MSDGPGVPFDAFLSAREESGESFVSQFLALSSEERARLLISLEGLGLLKEDSLATAPTREACQRVEELSEKVALAHAEAMAVEEATAAHPSCAGDVMSEEDVIELDNAIPASRTGYMTILFEDGEEMHGDVVFDSLQLEAVDGEQLPISREAVRGAPQKNTFVVPDDPDDFLAIDTPPPPDEHSPPARAQHQDATEGVNRIPTASSSDMSSSLSSLSCGALPGLDDEENNATDAGGLSVGKPHGLAMTEDVAADLNRVYREATDDVVPFRAEATDDNEGGKPISSGAALHQFNGDWKAYMLHVPTEEGEGSN